MCLVSDKIKFCTCVDDNIDIEEMEHYWILHRFVKGKDELTLGLPTMPVEYKDPNFTINRDTLLARINEPDAFDKPLKFKRKDRLELVLNNTEDYHNLLIFQFEYTGKAWKYEQHDSFELMNHYDEQDSGKLEEVFISE
jgi:hypothetical protein